MTPIEAGKFFEKAFLAFPGLSAWLRENSPDPARTCSLWASTLSKIGADEAYAVLDGWVDGSIKEPPVGFKRETFALNVKALAMAARQEINRERSREEQWIKSNRGRYQPSAAFRSIAKPFMQMLDNKTLLMNGEITHAEYDRLVDEITEQAFSNQPTAPNMPKIAS
jgi:hypothetical protein